MQDESFWPGWFQSGKGRLPPDDFTALLIAAVLKPGEINVLVTVSVGLAHRNLNKTSMVRQENTDIGKYYSMEQHALKTLTIV